MKGNYKGAPARSLLAMALAGGLALGAAPAMAQSTGATIRGHTPARSPPRLS